MTSDHVTAKYVGFCDVLGFSSAVLNNFDSTVALYRQFQQDVREWPFPTRAEVSVYSDSILVVSEDLPAVLHTVVSLNWATLLHGWLIRGGVAHGQYWESRENGNLFVVSDALVKAAHLEKTVKVPAVVVSPEISLGIEAWVPRFEHGPFKCPLLHFQGHTVVNPFNSYWFASAIARVRRQLEADPEHGNKYNWFLALAEAVARDDLLIPESALAKMLELGVIEQRAPNAEPPAHAG